MTHDTVSCIEQISQQIQDAAERLRDLPAEMLTSLEPDRASTYLHDLTNLLSDLAEELALYGAEQRSMLERERQRLEVIAEIARVVGQALDFQEVAEQVLEAAVVYLAKGNRQVFGTLQRLDKEVRELVDIAAVGYAADREDVRVPLGEGIQGRVATTGELLLIEDLSDEQWRDVFADVTEREIRSELAVPLVREGEVWGVLNVESPQPAAFDEDDQRLIEIVCSHILIALRNAEQHERLRQEQERRIAVEKWSALGEAVTGLMHHLGNYLGILPVTVRDIREIVIRKKDRFAPAELEDVTDDLATIEANARAGIGLLDGLRRAFTGEPPRIELVDVNVLLSSALQMAKPGLHNVDIVQRFALDLSPVQVDISRLTEAIAELIKNAEKAMPDEGGQLILGSRQVGDYVEIWVSDNGIGIPKEEQEKVFELFYKGDIETPGYGIGLSGVRSKVRSMSGDVWLHSDGPGCGTTVVIRLPASHRSA